MVACEVGEHAAGKSDTGYALLLGSVGADLHKCVVASGIDHFRQQRVEGERIGSGVGSGYGLAVHIVAYGRQQSGLVTLQPCYFVKQGGSGGFSVGAGDSHQLQLAAGMAVPRRCQHAESFGRVGHAYVGHPVFKSRGQLFAHYCADMGAGHHGYVFVAVGGYTFYGYKHPFFLYFARVGIQAYYIFVGVSYNFEHLYFS